MIIVNTETIPGYEVVELRGLVQGNTIRAKHLGRDIAASLKNLVGGELRGYTELLTEARRQSLERMMAQAQQLGANAIVNVRFTTSAITQGAAELYAYGTAVTVRAVEAEIKASHVDGAAMFRKENVPDPTQFGGQG
ncbi:MAG TPA: YbjQ family protein [Phycisphaerales bacterium]|nr:YbjQ family protein [Phycisphaerales bacterium]HRQ75530.1 YbjQ family protein [Phycisphaerales bacterium]